MLARLVLPLFCLAAPVQAQAPELVDKFLVQGGWSVEYGHDLSGLQGSMLPGVEDQARRCQDMQGAAQTSCYTRVGGAIEGYLGSALDALDQAGAARLTDAALGEAFANALSGEGPLRVGNLEVDIGVSPVTMTESVVLSRPTVNLRDCSSAIFQMDCPQITAEDSKEIVSKQQTLRPYIRLREAN